jgi:hypothetical protein
LDVDERLPLIGTHWLLNGSSKTAGPVRRAAIAPPHHFGLTREMRMSAGSNIYRVDSCNDLKQVF